MTKGTSVRKTSKKLFYFLTTFLICSSASYGYSTFNPTTRILTIPVLESTLTNGQILRYKATFKFTGTQFNLISLVPVPSSNTAPANAYFKLATQTLSIPRVNVGNRSLSAKLKWPNLFTLSLASSTTINKTPLTTQPTSPSSTPTGSNRSPSPPTASPTQLPEIVYVRVPRTNGSYSIKGNDGKMYTLTKADLWDSLPEVSRTIGGFNAYGQLVHRMPDGTETILYDCTGRPCSPIDPSVSPDGKKILFSVVTAKSIAPAWGIRDLPNELLGSPIDAILYVYDLTTGNLTQLAHQPGVRDISPIWLPDGNIMFASDRAGTLRPWLHWQSNPPSGILKQFQLYIADANGSNARNITPHEVAGAIHPYLLNNGRVAYSSHWLSHNLAYIGTNGSINWPTTLDNMWTIMDMNYQGGDTTALLGAHRHGVKTSLGRTKTMKALHFIGQRNNNDICTANYYRANNMGLGDIFCWHQQPKGIEGELPTFLPKGIYSLADWSKSNDEGSFTYGQLHIGDQSQRFIGKIGFPEGSPDGQLIITAGFGRCSKIGLDLAATLRLGNQPGCDIGLYKTTQIPSKTPADLIKIVDNPNWHEFNARVIQPRNIPVPTINTTQDNSCQLISSDAGTAETHLHSPYKFNHNYFNAANNGSEIAGLPHSELAGIRFYEVIPNKNTKQTFKNSIGNRLKFITDVPLLADKSFKVELPCDTPYIMAGIDIQGRIIKRDQIPQSLRPGEKRVCTGCHLHNRPGRPYEQSLAYNAAPVIGTLPSLPVPTYEKDIKPILTRRCASCHSNDVPLFDYNKLGLDFFQTFVPQNKKLVVNKNTTNPRARYGLQRPQWSKYINTMYARESLLYWKAANQRTDGRTDATYPDDIDFGTNHAVNITQAELRTIAEWLDSGANRN